MPSTRSTLIALLRALVLASGLTSVVACSDGGAGSSGASGGGGAGGGCGVAGTKTGLIAEQKIDVGGASRSYELFVPPEYDGNSRLALVFVFHGSGGDGAGIRQGYRLEAEAKGGAIFVYPDGLGKQWDLNGKAGENADIALFDALVDHVSTTYCVDRERIFATGFSNGAYFSNQLGCRRGDVLRAVATHAGGGPFGDDDEYGDDGNLVCPESPVAALVVHGKSDSTVALTEGHKSRDHWVRVNGCKAATSPYAPSPCVKYTGCAAERPVVYCEVPGLGHGVWDQGTKVTWSLFASLGGGAPK